MIAAWISRSSARRSRRLLEPSFGRLDRLVDRVRRALGCRHLPSGSRPRQPGVRRPEPRHAPSASALFRHLLVTRWIDGRDAHDQHPDRRHADLGASDLDSGLASRARRRSHVHSLRGPTRRRVRRRSKSGTGRHSRPVDRGAGTDRTPVGAPHPRRQSLQDRLFELAVVHAKPQEERSVATPVST
jgi:hypothetical protein